MKVAGYKLVLRGFWSPSTPLAIHSSLAQCAELCSGHPNCLRFSFQKSGVCSVYSRLDGAPTLTDACSYGFDQAGTSRSCWPMTGQLLADELMGWFTAAVFACGHRETSPKSILCYILPTDVGTFTCCIFLPTTGFSVLNH